ncbi:MAG: glycosyltransferase family 2 protein, partial [Deltaproteobacteria bacterium]
MTTEENVEVSIVMPAYNEEENIESTVRACADALRAMGKKGEIVVANDGSRDGTLERLKRLAPEVSNLVIVNHEKNLGYGAAIKSAIRASKGEYIVTIDSDGQFDINELPNFFGGFVNGTQVVTGYRKKKNDTFFRVFANRGLNGIITALFGARFNDINCAFRVYKGELLRSINIESRGYQAPSEIMLKLMDMGCSVREVGVSHLPRGGGQSALRPFRAIVQMTA